MKERTFDATSIFLLAFVLIITIYFNKQFNLGILQPIGLCIAIIGLACWIGGKISLGEHFTTSFKPKGLVTTGIFSKIRHPMYFGGTLIYLGLGLLFESVYGLILSLTLIVPLLVYSAMQEEKLLLEEFGEVYIEYKKKTII
jgi:protein-S-isoprenylcysteine O-methyltransferase Ste14